jgi:hypothetical protein
MKQAFSPAYGIRQLFLFDTNNEFHFRKERKTP